MANCFATFRLREETKALLRQAAEREHRSLANMLEVMIREWPGFAADGGRPPVTGKQPS